MAITAELRAGASYVSRHHPLGVSTGYMSALRRDWKSQVAAARAESSAAVEISALSEDELPSLLSFLSDRPELPFRYLSVHGPSKGRQLDEETLVDLLLGVGDHCDGIVMHPDTMGTIPPFRRLGTKLIIENMDSRKEWGRTADELAPVFEELPEAGFCFDVAHASSIDRQMIVANRLLDVFATKLRHVHLSSLSSHLHHVSLTEEDEELFRTTLQRCVDVPWILEAPPRAA